jgi:hypothetical protein
LLFAFPLREPVLIIALVLLILLIAPVFFERSVPMVSAWSRPTWNSPCWVQLDCST